MQPPPQALPRAAASGLPTQVFKDSVWLQTPPPNPDAAIAVNVSDKLKLAFQWPQRFVGELVDTLGVESLQAFVWERKTAYGMFVLSFVKLSTTLLPWRPRCFAPATL